MRSEDERSWTGPLIDAHAHLGRSLFGLGQSLEELLASMTESGVVQSVVGFARLTEGQIATYLATDEWHGKAGGYAIQGRAAAFIRFVSGSYSNVVGLPLFETAPRIWLRRRSGGGWRNRFASRRPGDRRAERPSSRRRLS